uniref:FAM13A-like domain-containing protein n=1 Tax=Gadus morhua TaxID=8049 RepID=A0A8C5FJ79_GADMO
MPTSSSSTSTSRTSTTTTTTTRPSSLCTPSPPRPAPTPRPTPPSVAAAAVASPGRAATSGGRWRSTEGRTGGGHSPLPSPRCSGHSLRFNSDPEAAPSPPSTKEIQFHCRERTEGPAVVSPSSVPLLTRHIGTLKKKVRRFEERFEQEMNYKPSYNDKNANPEMVKVMLDLAKSRKQLKEQHEPTLEETVESLFGRLREKRQTLGLPDNMKVKNQTKYGRNLVKPLYDRYQMIKRLLCASPTTITTIEEEGSDEDYTNHHQPAPPPCRVTWQAANEEDSDRDSDPALVSPIVEVKDVREKSPITVINLHEASRSELVLSLRETRVEKKRIRKGLREFEDEFYRQTGRTCQKEDRTPMSEEYQEYKQLKAKLRLLEILISKQEVN